MKHEPVLLNYLTWSAARVAAFQRCARAYYYQNIGSWNGWDGSAPAEAQAAYHLKYLTTPEAEVGLLIHDRIKSIFERAMMGRKIVLADEIKIAQWNFEQFLRRSAIRKIEAVTRKNRKLLADALGRPLAADEITRLLQRIEHLLTGFFSLGDVQTLLALPQDILPDFLDSQNFEIGSELGVPARVRTDAVWLKFDRVIIADWKCGRSSSSEKYRQQALTYDLYVRKKLRLVPHAEVEVRLYYLAERRSVAVSFTEDERQEHLWQIGEDFALLQSYSDDPVLNCGPSSRFRSRVGPACQRCPFQLMCPDYLRVMPAHPPLEEVL